MKIEKPGFRRIPEKTGERQPVWKFNSFAEMKNALTKRMEFFDEMGCRASDHGLDYAMYVPASEEEIEAIFAKGMEGEPISKEEELKYQDCIYAVMQEENTIVWDGQCSFITDVNVTMT